MVSSSHTLNQRPETRAIRPMRGYAHLRNAVADLALATRPGRADLTFRMQHNCMYNYQSGSSE